MTYPFQHSPNARIKVQRHSVERSVQTTSTQPLALAIIDLGDSIVSHFGIDNTDLAFLADTTRFAADN